MTRLGGWNREAGVHLGLDVAAAFVASAVFFLVAAALPIAGDVVLILLLGAVYLYVVLIAARQLGPLFAVPLAIAGTNAFDSFYIPPFREFGAENWQNWLVVAVYIAVGILIGLLGEYSRRRGDFSEARRSELASEHAVLRGVATLVARQASPDEVFAKVTEGVGRLLGAECAVMVRYPDAGSGRIVAAWGPVPTRQGQEFSLEHDSVSARVRNTERAARIDDYASGVPRPVQVAGDAGVQSAVGAPIVVAGAVWGAVIVGAFAPNRWAPDTESRIGKFTELAATAVSNMQGQADLAASRARIVASADHARRGFERDLHDGVQQRLVSLGLGVRNAEMMIPPGLEQAREQLALVGKELDSAVDELRELARGIHPAVLSEGGLAPALKSLANRSPVPIRVDVDVSRRLDEPTEVAAYYVVSEALTNTAKHACASVAKIRVQVRGGVLDVEVRDDGIGGANPAGGSGLTGLRDRVEALGGNIAIASPNGAGTSLHARLPIA